MGYTDLIDESCSWHSWPLIFKERHFFYDTRHGMHLTCLQFTPSWLSMGQKCVAIVLFFCACLSHVSFLIGCNWKWHISRDGTSDSSLGSFFLTIPTDCSIEWLQWQTRLTSDWLVGGKAHTSGVPPGGWFLLSLFPFLSLSLILSRLRLPDCV